MRGYILVHCIESKLYNDVFRLLLTMYPKLNAVPQSFLMSDLNSSNTIIAIF